MGTGVLCLLCGCGRMWFDGADPDFEGRAGKTGGWIELRAPHLGARSGSTSLRPRFVWEPAAVASTYELQLDDSCEPGAYRGCAFPSPVTFSTESTELVPDADLPVSQVAPVGARYYWRVRACAPLCGPWSEVRYLDVGRAESDFNGDGYGDIAVGANQHANPAAQEGAIYVVYGAADANSVSEPMFIDSPANVAEAQFGFGLADAGDINADGFSDLIAGAPYPNVGDAATGSFYVFYGSANGIDASPNLSVEESPVGALGSRLGQSVAGVGDMNGDGYADVVVGAPREGEGGGAHFYLGGPDGLSPSPFLSVSSPIGSGRELFADSLSGIGDVDGDGYSDAAIGALEHDGAELRSGRVQVFFGGPEGPKSTDVAVVDAPDPQLDGHFGRWQDGGDIDGDGFSDLVVSASELDYPEVDEGVAYVFRGSRQGLSPPEVIDNPDDQADGKFGSDLALGDFDGDGLADLVVGAYAQSSPSFAEGNAFVFFGAVGLSSATRLENPTDQGIALFGNAVSLSSDLNGDGRADAVIGSQGYDDLEVDEGSAFVFFGEPAAAERDDSPDLTLHSSVSQAGAGFGFAVTP